MIDLLFFSAAFAALLVLMIFFIRQKGSYFKSVQILLLIAFSAIASIVFTNVIKNYAINKSWMMTPYILWGTSAGIIAALAVEHTAFILHRQQTIPLEKELFQNKMALISLLFKTYAIAVLATAWIWNPWQVKSGIPTLWGNLVYGFTYSDWYTALLGVLLIAAVSYPCIVFLLLSRRCDDRHLSNALWWLGICWTLIGATLILFHALLRSLNLELVEVSSLFYVLYYGIIAYHFKQTTTLEGLFKTSSSSLHLREGEHLVVFYTRKVSKWKLFSAYINQGIRKGDRVIYAYSDTDAGLVRAKLKEEGVDVEKHEQNGSLVLMGISHVYMRNGIIDKGQLINFWNDLKADTKKDGFRHERDLFDLGDLSFLGDQKESYFEYLREANTQLMDPFMIELRAVNVEGLSPQLIQEFKFLSTKSMDLLEYSDKFSKRIGVNHGYVIGRNLLLEFDPASNYEEAVQDFVLEASANAESVIIFTNRGGTLHTLLNRQENVKFLLLTSFVSVPKNHRHLEEVLVPANNVSLLLDALNKAVKNHPDGNFNFVFDSLTNLILQVGFDKSYNFVRYALEILSSISATSIFLFTPSAHDQKIASSLRSLFSNQIAFEKGGLEIIKLPEELMKA
ncbi:MAG: MEDS domain-containing protein [Candidatus Bathyarchaeota archaeon]|nr:MEDS domain-containing protein [Candidatus Bathyarchaeota archaeon]